MAEQKRGKAEPVKVEVLRERKAAKLHERGEQVYMAEQLVNLVIWSDVTCWPPGEKKGRPLVPDWNMLLGKLA